MLFLLVSANSVRDLLYCMKLHGMRVLTYALLYKRVTQRCLIEFMLLATKKYLVKVFFVAENTSKGGKILSHRANGEKEKMNASLPPFLC